MRNNYLKTVKFDIAVNRVSGFFEFLRNFLIRWSGPSAIPQFAFIIGLLLVLVAPGALAQIPAADSFNPFTSGSIGTLALQTDRAILVGGGFTALDGQSRTNLGRLDADGAINSFNPGMGKGFQFFNPDVYALVLQDDGTILVGGTFGTLDGQDCIGLGKLNCDGTLNTSFNLGANGYVYSLALQDDGKILIVGNFTTPSGQACTIGRFNTDGTLDTNFITQSGYSPVYCLALQSDGRIVIGGSFTNLSGQNCTNIGRLNADGSLDTSFNPGTGVAAYSPVYCLAIQPDGKILVGGSFSMLGGQPRSNFGRLNADGTLDTNFNAGATDYGSGVVLSLGLQADGKIIVGGGFTSLGGLSHTNIGRLNPDGTVDPSFNAVASGAVECLAIQADGKTLVVGAFNYLSNQYRPGIGRLNSTGLATQSMAFNGSTVTWMRGGTSPEVWRTTFEYSLDGGASWITAGAGNRIAGGWQLAGLTIPTNTILQARGYVAGGYYSGSGWFVESLFRPDLTLSNCQYSVTGQFGFDISGPFGQSVVVEASSDLSSWLPIWTNTIRGATVSFSDGQSETFPKRFYRARAP